MFDEGEDQIFPTREGALIGTSNERTMLESVGARGIRTKIQNNIDGSTTMLRTRNGFPEFTTSAVTSTQEKTTVYLESGQIDVGSMGTTNPERFDRGFWSADLIQSVTSAVWLGYADSKTGAQKNDPKLTASQWSLSLGGSGSYADPEVEETNEAYFEKKKCLYYVHPSNFTGRMRLFVQAIYGKKDVNGATWKGTANYDDIPSLEYDGISISSFPYSTTVLFFDSEDSSYFLLNIGTSITATPLILPSWASSLAKIINSSIWTNEEKTRAEAYIFAYATIDSGNSFTIPGDSITSVSAIAYGWKANWNGTKVSIVDVQTKTPIDQFTEPDRFISRVYTINITRLNGVWSYSTVVVEGPTEWMSLFGRSNVWVPFYDGVGRKLRRFELSTYITHSPFSAPIYCYYNHADELVIVRYTYSENSRGGIYEHYYSGPRGVNGRGGWDASLNTLAGYGPAWTGTTISDDGYDGKVVTVSVDSAQTEDLQFSRTNISERVDTYPTTSPPDSDAKMWTNTIQSPGDDSPGYNFYLAAKEIFDSWVSLTPNAESIDIHGTERENKWGLETFTQTASMSATASTCVIIPVDDCEAAYVSVIETQQSSSGIRLSGYLYTAYFSMTYKFSHYDSVSHTYEDMIELGPAYLYTGIYLPSGYEDSVVIDESSVTTYQYIGQNKYGSMTVNATPHDDLHYSDRAYPFSEHIHRTHTSAGGAVCGTEISGTNGAVLLNTFVGGV